MGEWAKRGPARVGTPLEAAAAPTRHQGGGGSGGCGTGVEACSGTGGGVARSEGRHAHGRRGGVGKSDGWSVRLGGDRVCEAAAARAEEKGAPAVGLLGGGEGGRWGIASLVLGAPDDGVGAAGRLLNGPNGGEAAWPRRKRELGSGSFLRTRKRGRERAPGSSKSHEGGRGAVGRSGGQHGERRAMTLEGRGRCAEGASAGDGTRWWRRAGVKESRWRRR